MSQQSPAIQLLQHVGRRLLLARAARALHVWSLAAMTLAAAAVLVVRLAGLLPPEQQSAWWLLAIPAAAGLGAGMFFRRVDRTAAARAVDQFARTDDLFLTLVTLQSSAGQYQPLVEQSAVGVAPRIMPRQVVPFRTRRSLGIQAVAVSALALLLVLVPTLDPFGRVEAAVKVQQQKKQVEQLLKSVRTRDEQVSREVKAAEERQQKIDAQAKELMAALRKMKSVERQPNSEVLDSQRQNLNQLWKQASSEQVREMLSQNSESMTGSQRGQKMNDWLKELQDGRTDSLQKEFEKAQETLKSMLNADSAAERQKLASELKKQLQDLKKFSSQKAGSKELEKSLDSALKALEAMQQNKFSQQGEQGESGERGEKSESGERGEDGEPQSGEGQLSEQVRQALEESLKLSQKELQELARAAGDMKQLEEALKTLQQAEKLNQQGQMDGEECEGCQSLADYAEKFRKKMGGMGQNGQAERSAPGAMMSEDGSDPEGYKNEKSRTQIQAGKVLMSIKTKEAARQKDFDPEDLRKYDNTVQQLKAGVDAAIEAEEIPPGYVDSIRQYFDKIEGGAEPAAAAPAKP